MFDQPVERFYGKDLPPGRQDHFLHIPEFPEPISDNRQFFGDRFIFFPIFPQIADGQANKVAVGNTSRITKCRVYMTFPEIRQVLRYQVGNAVDRIRQPFPGTVPVERQTKTVSMMDDPVPLIWMEAPIPPGRAARPSRSDPASRMATATGK